ncbi:MAG: peptidylprolyl isomerase [Alphaproteobacteria bacterium]
MVGIVARLALAAAMLAVPVTAQAQWFSKKSSDDPVAAKVDRAVISRSDVATAQQMLPPQYRSAPLESVYPLLLDELVDTKLVVAEARKEKLQNDPDIKRRLAYLEEQLLKDAYLRRYVQKVLNDDVLRKRYEELVKSLPPQEEVRARHILVKTKAEAEAIIKKLKAGTPFETLAKEKSTDSTAAAGGDLGYFGRTQMVAPFATAAFALKPGQITEKPVETQYGWHVIKLEDKRTAPLPPFEDVRDQLQNQMARDTVLTLIGDLRKKAKIERYNFDGTPRPPEQ